MLNHKPQRQKREDPRYRKQWSKGQHRKHGHWWSIENTTMQTMQRALEEKNSGQTDNTERRTSWFCNEWTVVLEPNTTEIVYDDH